MSLANFEKREINQGLQHRQNENHQIRIGAITISRTNFFYRSHAQVVCARCVTSARAFVLTRREDLYRGINEIQDQSFAKTVVRRADSRQTSFETRSHSQPTVQLEPAYLCDDESNSVGTLLESVSDGLGHKSICLFYNFVMYAETARPPTTTLAPVVLCIVRAKCTLTHQNYNFHACQVGAAATV